MRVLGFIWRAPRRRPALAASLFVLAVGLGMLSAKGLGSMAIVAVASLLGAAAVAFLGAALADWQEGLIREPWQLREQLNIEVLARLDADLMRRARAELSYAGPGTNA